LFCANIQATFEKLENEMKEINSNAEALKRNFLDLTELKHILRKTQGFFEEVYNVELELNVQFFYTNIPPISANEPVKYMNE